MKNKIWAKKAYLVLTFISSLCLVFILRPSIAGAFFSGGRIIDKVYLASKNPKVIDKTFSSKNDAKSVHLGSIITNKDTYLPGENITFSISLLDVEGKMVCDAEIFAEIHHTSGRTYSFSTNNGIVTHPNCQRYEFVLGPDISFDFSTQIEGEYYANLLVNSMGKKVKLATTNFKVDKSPEFVIERVTSHRVFPDAEQVMQIKIKSTNGFNGEVVEYLPNEIQEIKDVYEVNTLHLMSEREKILAPDFTYTVSMVSPRSIKWDVQLEPGREYLLSYGYVVSAKSPIRSVFRPLRLGGDSEYRSWEMAIDGLAVSTVDATVALENERYETGGNRNIVTTTSSSVYAFYVSGNSAGTGGQRAAYKKSTNAGNTWGTEIFPSSATSGIELMTSWYDRWTPGDSTGNLVHMVYLNSATDSLIYRNLNTSNDSLGSETTVYSDASTTRSSTSDSLSMAKSVNGTLYVASSSSSASSSSVVYSSTDFGASWSLLPDEGLDDGSGDWVLLMPLLNNNIMIIRWDLSTDTIESKIYDSESNTWDVGWTTVATGAVDGATITETFSSTLDPGSGEIYLAYLSGPGTNPATIETRIYNSGSWSTGAQVRSFNTIQGISMGYDSDFDRVVVVYSLGTAETTLTLRYKDSYDGMTSFGSERLIYNVADDIKGVAMTFLSNNFLSAYTFDDDDRDIFFSAFSRSGGEVYGISVTNALGFESSDSFDANSETGTTSFSSAIFRSGEYALRSNPTSSTGYVTHPVQYAATGAANTADIDNVSALFALRIAQTPSGDTDIFNFMDGTINELRVQLDTGRNLNLIDASTVSGAFQLDLDTWYIIAVWASDDYDAGELMIFSSDMQSLYERITISSVMNDIDSIRIGSQTASITTDLYFDDLLIHADDNITSFPLFRANYQIHRMDLDSIGTDTAWTGDYTSTDEIPTSSADYIEVTNTIADETSGLESASSAGIDSENIIGIMVKNTVWETTEVTSSVRTIRLRIPGAIETTALNVSTAVADYGLWRNRNSSNVLLSTSTLDSLQVGVGNDTASGTTHRNGSSVVQTVFFDDWSDFTQSTYRFYVDNDSELVDDPWGNPNLAENSNLSVVPSTNSAPTLGDEIRLRVGILVGNSDISVGAKRFKLQYKQGTDMSCTSGAWYDVGDYGESSPWTFAQSSVSDGDQLSSTVLSTSDVAQAYVKSNPTVANLQAASVGENIEYDFHLYNNSATEATTYSFRVVNSNGLALQSYSSCPTLTTMPTNSLLMRHGKFFADSALQGYIW